MVYGPLLTEQVFVCPINPMKVKEIEEWSRNDSKAKCVLRRTLTDVYFNHTRDCRTGKAIFDRIVELMEPKSVNVLLHSWQEFHSYTWMEGDNVTSFWSGLSVIVSKIEAAGEDVKPSMIMSKVLVCLPEKFANFRTSWDLISTTSSTITEFKTKLLSAERSIPTTSDDVCVLDAALKATRVGSKNFVKKSERSPFTCYNCGKPGHRASECRSKESSKKKNNSRGSKKPSEESSDAKSKNRDRDVGPKKAMLVASTAFNAGSELPSIIIDSGATDHMTENARWFSSLKELGTPHEINVAGQWTLKATAIGNIDVEVKRGGRWFPITWKDVLLVPKLGPVSLVSYDRLNEGRKIESQGKTMVVSEPNGEIVLRATKVGRHFVPDIRVVQPKSTAMWLRKARVSYGTDVSVMSLTRLYV